MSDRWRTVRVMTVTLSARALSAVDAAVEVAKFPASRRAHYLALYGRDPVGTQALIDALTPVPEAFVDLPDSPGDPDADDLYVGLYGQSAR
jgi:hypothetical protein